MYVLYSRPVRTLREGFPGAVFSRPRAGKAGRGLAKPLPEGLPELPPYKPLEPRGFKSSFKGAI